MKKAIENSCITKNEHKEENEEEKKPEITNDRQSNNRKRFQEM